MHAPKAYKNAGTLMMVSGILSALAAFGIIASLIWFFCVGLLWLPALVIAIAEIAVGYAAMNGEQKPSMRTISILGLLGAVCCGNMISLALEIIALVQLNDSDAQDFLLTGLPPQEL